MTATGSSARHSCPERWELVNGEIIGKIGQDFLHGNRTNRVAAWLTSVFGAGFVMNQSSIDVSPEDNPTSKPQPDITVISAPADRLTRNPVPAQIVLVVEISDTTLLFDLSAKALLYARAGIPEYWVADVDGQRFHQFREPGPDGYAWSRKLTGDTAVAPLGRTETATVAQLLEPRP